MGGEAFSIDASLIKADVDKKKRVAGDGPIEWPMAEEASHAVREYLAALDGARSEDDGGEGTGGGTTVIAEASLPLPRTCPSGTSPSRPEDASRRKDFVFDREVNVYICPSGAASRTQGLSIRGAFFPTGRARPTVRSARSSPNAQRRSPARSRVTSTRTRAIRCAGWPTPRPSRFRAASARR